MAADCRADFEGADVLAIAAHRDDVEQTCGGTLLRMAARGLRTAILDLTQGEAGTRGSAKERAAEAADAAKLLGVGWRQALSLPDGALQNTLENRIEIARVLRQLRPRVVILPYWQARHPDHAAVATLGYEACFLSGLAKAPVIASAPNAPQAPLAAPQAPWPGLRENRLGSQGRPRRRDRDGGPANRAE